MWPRSPTSLSQESWRAVLLALCCWPARASFFRRVSRSMRRASRWTSSSADDSSRAIVIDRRVEAEGDEVSIMVFLAIYAGFDEVVLASSDDDGSGADFRGVVFIRNCVNFCSRSESSLVVFENSSNVESSKRFFCDSISFFVDDGLAGILLRKSAIIRKLVIRHTVGSEFGLFQQT